jgi:hypothetical protein
MAVTNVSTNALTVVRQSNQTNSSSANIAIGNNAYTVATLEIAQVQSVTNGTTLQLNRGWYNSTAADSYATGTVMQRLSANVELCQHTVISTAINGTQTITRGELNTTALTAAGVGSPVIRMTGMFYATGANTIPQVGVNQSDTPVHDGEYVSTQNTNNSNTEGVGLVFRDTTNNFFYYPKRSPSLAPGYPLNQTDTIIRQAYPYTGADMDVASISADGANPATVTVTTTYAHGLVPGTPILMNFVFGHKLPVCRRFVYYC